MKYGYNKLLKLEFKDAIQKTKEALMSEGFGVLTEIDVKKTMKEKLNIDFEEYVILGACNPPFAHKALVMEEEIGLLLPCNVVIYQKEAGVMVSAILPSSAMSIVGSNDLNDVAKTVEDKIKKVIDNI